MVNRTVALIFFVLLGAAWTNANLQFSPKVAEYDLDGVKLKQLVFSDGTGRKIIYAPPTGWSYSGSATKLTLRPPSVPQAEGTIASASLPEPVLLDAEGMKKLTQEALASVPSGSTDVVLVSQEKNPLMIEKKETFLVTLSYVFYGEKFGSSILFLHRGNEQVRCQLVSRLSDFKDLQRAFLGSQYSWQNL